MLSLPRRVLAIVALNVLAFGLTAADPFNGRLALTIDGALAQNFKGGAQDPTKGSSLELHASCENGVWSDCWGYAKTFNVSIHLGEVVGAEVAGDSIKLTVKVAIDRDNWISGGRAEYALALTRTGDAVVGTCTGVFNGDGAKPWLVKDAVVNGYVLPANPVRPGFVPVQPGEHPRLLVRKADLPALRERAKTPFGQAIVAQMKQAGDPVSLGMLFQLTGDRAYAERAFPETVKVMNNRNGGAFALGRFWGYRTNVVGNAYDLCHDVWTREQKDQVENYLDDIIDLCLNRKHRVGTVNWSPGSNYTAVIHSGNGVAALALWGEKCLPPVEPTAPRSALARLTADAGLIPGKGVPVVALPIGRSISEWLWVGPFNLNVNAGDDCLAATGGSANASPELGTKVAFKDQTLEWKPLSLSANPDLFVDGRDGVNPGQIGIRTPLLAGGEQKRLFFYAVVDNPAAGFYRFKANFWNGACYIAGQRFVDGEIVHLAQGRFPLLVPVIVGSPTGQASPVFVAATEAEATAYYADEGRKKAYASATAAWSAALAAWKASDGINQTWLRNVRMLAAWNYLNLQRGMGDGGFQGEGEGYTIECHHMPHDAALVFQNVLGRSLSGHPDISHFAARYVHAAQWKGGKAFQQSYGGHGGGTIPSYYFPRAIALAPQAWHPALLGHWLRLAGTTHDEVVSGAGVAKLISQSGHDDVLTPIWTLLNYPLDLKPASPEGILPKAWEAKTRGYYAFRNGWKGDDDIIASIYAKQGVSAGWNQAEAGCFQIHGLGGEWAYKSNDASGKNGSRWLDNVVMLPEDPITANARAKVSYAKIDTATGGGVVTIDMDAVYQLVDPAKIAKAKPPKPKNVNPAKPGESKAAEANPDEALPPSETTAPVATGGARITGLRSFAADYSGAGGVPGLFAIADRISGGGKKIWVFQPPRGQGTSLTIAGNTFTLTRGTASMRATFVGAPGITIQQATGLQAAHPASGVADVDSQAIHATIDGGAGGEFFVILTLQNGPAPAVTSVGSGLAATATVGGQSVRFDGEKLVLGR